MAVNEELLLFMEPQNEPSKKPVIDELTMKMTASFRKAKKGAIHDYQQQGQGYEFHENDGWCGWHNCSCGANAGGQDYLLSNGEMTNGNCVHYLAYHREEISKEQLDRVFKLDDGLKKPKKDEIERDRERWFPICNPDKVPQKKAMTRQEYLESLDNG
jgi:hypothetical protein